MVVAEVGPVLFEDLALVLRVGDFLVAKHVGARESEGGGAGHLLGQSEIIDFDSQRRFGSVVAHTDGDCARVYSVGGIGGSLDANPEGLILVGF